MQLEPISPLTAEQWDFVKLVLQRCIKSSTWKNQHLREGAATLAGSICAEMEKYARSFPPGTAAERQLAECQKECEEQARLNGMGSEREARLMAQLAELQRKHDALVKETKGCICEGNWRQIVRESTPLFDKIYRDREGNECVFFGVVWASDDFYYGMFRKDTKTVALLSCVGDIEGFGYEQTDAAMSAVALDKGDE